MDDSNAYAKSNYVVNFRCHPNVDHKAQVLLAK